LYYLAVFFRDTKHAAVGGPNVAPIYSDTIADCVDNAPGGPIHVLITDENAEHLPGCNLAVRKSCLEVVGGFDSTFRVAGDDVDLCWRLRERGWSLGFSPGALVFHHRRHTIKDYWRQQSGYGKAEALLERKWPEKYNSAGHHTFAGYVYGKGMVHVLFRRTLIYYGFGGFAPFQSLYERGPRTLGTLPLMPEWYLLIAFCIALSTLGLTWKPLLLLAAPIGAAALVLSLTQAIVGGLDASFHTASRPGLARAWRRCFTAFLHALQPLARLSGRISCGLTMWRRRGAPGVAIPRPRSSAVWTKDWQAPEERLARILRALQSERAVIQYGGDHDRWDLEVVGGMFGSVRMLMAVEDHGGGNQLVRIRSWPRGRSAAAALAGLLAALTVLSALDGSWLVSTVLGSTLVCLVWNALAQAGQATAAVLRATK
jgi:hypothetical protein